METGLCLREIQEPEPTRYHNMNHQVGSAKPPSSSIFPTITRVSSIGSFTCVFMRVIYRFTTNYLVTVPDLPFDKKRVMTIRDLGLIAMDLQSHRTQSASALLATRELVSGGIDHCSQFLRDWNSLISLGLGLLVARSVHSR